MTREELRRNEAAKWLSEAAKDKHAAELLADAEPSRSVFHSQQTAEKALKGLLTFAEVTFRKTHDLTDLGAECAELVPSLEPLLREISSLSDYASMFRYPDAPYEPDSEEAKAALEVAARLLEEIKRRMA